MLSLDWALAGQEGIALGMSMHNRSKDQAHADDPSQTGASSAVGQVVLAGYDLHRHYLDKIQELDQRVKVLSQCIAREVEDNQELRDRVEELEYDRQSLLKSLARALTGVGCIERDASRDYWLKSAVVELPSRLHKELLPQLLPFQVEALRPLVGDLEHTQKSTQIPDTKASNAGKPRMKIRSIDQLLQAWQEKGSVSTL